VNLDEHAMNLGRILGNLQSLESMLRMTIGTIDKSRRSANDFSALKVGDRVPADAVTNYDSLGPTIRFYNRLVPAEDRLDVGALVTLRDILAHGRIINVQPTLPLRLVKFGKEENGTVRVEAIVEMTQSWFAEQRQFVYRCVETVAAVNRRGSEKKATE